ncbi:MAG TPA: SAM-dependent methyltransferase [Ornithinimicrobium sp.]|uniref:SAM-dependent methyltransferase n=1 Tax=Ornithinimicrobium sp. TaxID=1977084 RepID=UPI002B461710|nr:SAM-dependent methyltransferase [Ornithinimicrobium sp.]HKJ11256.1 SAM-dependent methyltransferase [Ornithinimicrobium sp.]
MTRLCLPWPRAWQQALYGPHGFYRRRDGPAGHFSTSVAGIPHAGAVMARALAALATRLGRTTVVDLGAGRGELIAHLARAAPHLRAVGVDVVAAPPDLPASVQWWVSPGGEDLPPELDGLTGALVVAHEWLDVVPTTVARRDLFGVWRAGHVNVSTGEESWPHPVREEERAWLEAWADADTEIAEVGLARERALAALRRSVRDCSVLVVDYGHHQGERPPQGTLVGYRDGGMLPAVPNGSMDLTAHVAIDALVASCGEGGVRWARQREMLPDLLDPPPLDAELARPQPAAYLQQVAEQAAWGELCRRGGLGDFWWVLTEPPARLAR